MQIPIATYNCRGAAFCIYDLAGFQTPSHVARNALRLGDMLEKQRPIRFMVWCS